MHNKVRKAIIPAAGFGTRMLPATKSVPKELLPIIDRPIIDYIVAEAFASGIEHVVIVTGRMKGAIEDYSTTPSKSTSACATPTNIAWPTRWRGKRRVPEAFPSCASNNRAAWGTRFGRRVRSSETNPSLSCSPTC